MTRQSDREAPRLPGYQVADMAGGLLAAFSVCSALLSRELANTGGEYLDVALTDAVVSFAQALAPEALGGDDPRPGETPLTGQYPWYDVYETKDGRYVTLGALEPQFWSAFCDAIDRKDLVDAHMTGDPAERAALREELVDVFRSRTRDEWADAMASVDAAVDGVYTPGINGLAIDAILDLADVLIAEVNPREPALPGIEIETDRFDHRLPVDYNLPVLSTAEPDDVARTIGGAVADLIPDGSTLHVGYGSIPSAIAESLTDHENLGLHTGMVSPSVVDLLEEGVIARGSIVAEPLADCPFERPALATTTLGDSRSFYDWVESSRMVAIGSIGQMHDPCAAAANPKFTAVNSGVQVDLQGQVNAERMGARRFGGPGGQPDFFRIARSSEGGAGILALSSTHGGDVSTIVGRIAAGGVVTTPGHSLDYVVTEHAVADLRTATERERTSQLIETAAPRFRDDLRETAAEYGLR
jgi:acyl CoA:acetate/3-ketoacid CoA transferase beta subunit